MTWRVILVAALVMVLGIPSASAQGAHSIARHVTISGGRSSARLSGAIGQPVSGITSTSAGRLCSGFWCGFGAAGGGNITNPSGAAVRLAYRITFGQLSWALCALVLFALVMMRNIESITRGLWGK